MKKLIILFALTIVVVFTSCNREEVKPNDNITVVDPIEEEEEEERILGTMLTIEISGGFKLGDFLEVNGTRIEVTQSDNINSQGWAEQKKVLEKIQIFSPDGLKLIQLVNSGAWFSGDIKTVKSNTGSFGARVQQ